MFKSFPTNPNLKPPNFTVDTALRASGAVGSALLVSKHPTLAAGTFYVSAFADLGFNFIPVPRLNLRNMKEAIVAFCLPASMVAIGLTSGPSKNGLGTGPVIWGASAAVTGVGIAIQRGIS